MRIRKRFPPSSSLSSLPLSDPQLSRSLVVVQVQPQPRNNINQEHPHGNLILVQEELIKANNPDRSDHRINLPLQHSASSQEMMIGAENPMRASPQNSVPDQIMKEKENEDKEMNDERLWKMKMEEKKNGSNDISLYGAEVNMQLHAQSSSSIPAFERWIEGDRTVPLKKRKGSFERIGSATKEIVTKPRMKSKTNKKCIQENGQELQIIKETDKDQENSTTSAPDTKKNNSTTKKNKRGNVIMEGSRCSRVNGRGWRCCQQTLVGYSLCEHHLGKGRLRSMSSVRNRANSVAARDNNSIEMISTARILTLLQSSEKKIESNEDGEKGSLKKKKKKRVKIGAVKARSISSLLGQTDQNESGGHGNAANRNKK